MTDIDTKQLRRQHAGDHVVESLLDALDAARSDAEIARSDAALGWAAYDTRLGRYMTLKAEHDQLVSRVAALDGTAKGEQ